jgi:hypothetical protein
VIGRAIRRFVLALLVAAMAAVTPATAADSAGGQARPPDLTLTGVLTGTDNRTYIALPFQVPEGVERITVEFAYTGKAERTTIDLGLFDPHGFRGWSGGNKSRFTLSEADATPSYLAGAIAPGEWRLLLGVPNIRSASRSTYVARIWFDRRGETAAFTAPPLRPESRWYRGDFHVHSGHSDGTCKSRLGATVPCPVFRILQEAAGQSLDFVALTDHNTTSQFGDIAGLQPWFDDLLILPGREITTFQGHANLFGPTAFVDFRLGSDAVPEFDALLDAIEGLGGLVSINHPSLPSGEFCMGCGWTAKTDWARVDALEVINGGAVAAAGGKADTGMSGLALWEGLLNRGFRITAIGGSDSHDADRPAGKPGALGRPTTVVYAEGLSQAAILGAVKAGRVYVDVEGSGATLAFFLEQGKQTWGMGEAVCAKPGAHLSVTAISGVLPDSVVEIVASPNLTPDRIARRGPTTFELTADGAAGWVRANVRSVPDGRLLVVGNPVYLLAKGC